MHRYAKRSLVILMVAALILIPFGTQAFAQEKNKKEYSAEKMAADLLLVRPVGILATLFGGAVFIVALPFSLLGGNTEDTYQNLVVAPAKYTFKRPIGDI